MSLFKLLHQLICVPFCVSLDIQKQFVDQIKVLDLRTENKVFLINDVQEFFKRRSELECEMGKNLDRLSDRFIERLQKQRSNYGLSR